ncbi:hypothetical protein R6Q59_004084, partial [Mikania micrantha]
IRSRGCLLYGRRIFWFLDGKGGTLVCAPYRSVPSYWTEGYGIRGGSCCVKGGVRQSC